MNGNVTEVDMVQFYVEVFHTRGNFTKFEWISEDGTEVLELDVWNFRRRDHEYWHLGFIIEAASPVPQRFRITRYPDLEKDVLDTPYHPSVDSWNIDPNQVKEHFSGSE